MKRWTGYLSILLTTGNRRINTNYIIAKMELLTFKRTEGVVHSESDDKVIRFDVDGDWMVEPG